MLLALVALVVPLILTLVIIILSPNHVGTIEDSEVGGQDVESEAEESTENPVESGDKKG